MKTAFFFACAGIMFLAQVIAAQTIRRPFFCDNPPAGANFNLQPGSPAIDAGAIIPGFHCPVAGPCPVSCDNGQPCIEWLGTAPDIGACEFVPTTPANLPPVATIVSPASETVNVGTSVQFTGSGSDPDNNLPLTFKWNFGASGIPDSTLQNPLGVFNNLGAFTISFTVTDALGAASPTVSVVITVVQPQTPTHTVSINSVPISGVPIGVSLPDVNRAQDGTTNFVRVYPDGTATVILTAPATAGRNRFFNLWTGCSIASDNLCILSNISKDENVTANYILCPGGKKRCR